MTHTYAILDVSPAVYAEIREKLRAAGYQHAFHHDREGEVIDMHGIALREATLEERLAALDRSTVEFQALKKADAGSATAALARIQAEDHRVRREDYYDVQWSRPGEHEILYCNGVPSRELAKRLAAASRNYGPGLQIETVAPAIRACTIVDRRPGTGYMGFVDVPCTLRAGHEGPHYWAGPDPSDSEERRRQEGQCSAYADTLNHHVAPGPVHETVRCDRPAGHEGPHSFEKDAYYSTSDWRGQDQVDRGRGPAGSPGGPLPTLEEIEAELRYQQQQAQ